MNNFCLAHLTHLILGEIIFFSNTLVTTEYLTNLHSTFPPLLYVENFHVCAWVFVIFLAIFQPPSLYPQEAFSVLYLLLLSTNILVILIHNYRTDHHPTCDNSQIYTCVSDLSSEFLIHNMQFSADQMAPVKLKKKKNPPANAGDAKAIGSISGVEDP